MAGFSFAQIKMMALVYFFFSSSFCFPKSDSPTQVNPPKRQTPLVKASKKLQKPLPPPKKSASTFLPSLGISALTYKEGNYANCSLLVLTGKIGYNYLIPNSKWDIGLNAYMTLVPIKEDISKIGTRFLGINARTGYLIDLSSSWKLGLSGGFYYATMIVDQNLFGFSHLIGAQFYPTLRKSFSFGVLSSYFKFSPVVDSLTDFNPAHHEIAFGLSWSFPIGNEQNQFHLSIDQAKLSTAIDSIQIQSNSTTGSIGISF